MHARGVGRPPDPADRAGQTAFVLAAGVSVGGATPGRVDPHHGRPGGVDESKDVAALEAADELEHFTVADEGGIEAFAPAADVDT